MSDAVNHPSHYHAESGHEVLEVIHAWGLGFNTGNALKYIARAGHKDPTKRVQDLQKAVFYLTDEIDRLENNDGCKT